MSFLSNFTSLMHFSKNFCKHGAKALTRLLEDRKEHCLAGLKFVIVSSDYYGKITKRLL